MLRSHEGFSHWVILQPLRPEHAKVILFNFTREGAAFSFVSEINEEKQLDLLLIDWTAGGPRGLLYVLHLIDLMT
jgi:hypothetical protein